MFITITLFVCGVWLIGTALMMKTNNGVSSIIFKVIPFFMGLSCIIAFIRSIGRSMSWKKPVMHGKRAVIAEMRISRS